MRLRLRPAAGVGMIGRCQSCGERRVLRLHVAAGREANTCAWCLLDALKKESRPPVVIVDSPEAIADRRRLAATY